MSQQQALAAPHAKQLQNLLSDPQRSLEQKIDAFKKLRNENKITEELFSQIMTILGKFHQQGQQQQQQQQGKSSSSDDAARNAPPATASSAPTGFKRKSPGDDVNGPPLSAEPTPYPMSTTVNPARTEPQSWPSGHPQRPTLSGGLPSGIITGTPPIVARGQEDVTLLLSGDLRHGPKKNPAVEQSMRRTIQELVSSIDPNVKIASEVEDILLEVADEFIDSVSNFSCRLAKHRGGDTLETRDLQLHLERNHNIRIPGFASDETRLSISQSAVLPQTTGAPATKKSAQGTHMTLRSARLTAVAQAKRDNKLM